MSYPYQYYTSGSHQSSETPAYALAFSPAPPEPQPGSDQSAHAPPGGPTRTSAQTPLAINTSDPFEDFITSDWAPEDEFGAHLQRKADAKLKRTNDKRVARGKAPLLPDERTAMDRLWDDRWDNDDVSDAYSQKLRQAVLDLRAKEVEAAAEAEVAVAAAETTSVNPATS